MAKVLVLYHSAYGHIEAMANAVAEGARSAGAIADVKRVPELVPAEVAKAAYYKLDQAAPVATIADLEAYDAIVVGAGTRFGRMPAQMANFLDQAGGLWAKGALNGKVGAAFTSTATQHGGQETTLFSIIVNLLHFGMTIVGLPYSFQGQMTLGEVTGGAPYGATTIAGGDGSRQPSENELAGARFQGKLVAETAGKLRRLAAAADGPYLAILPSARSAMTARLPLHLDVVSDVVCPWCYIGKRRLERALAAIDDVAVTVRWRPFFLNPWIPREGIARAEYLEKKFGSVARYGEIAARVAQEAAGEGLTYDASAISRQPNTVDCHRLIRWAADIGRAGEMKQILMDRYFRDGADLTRIDVLVEAAAVCGLDAGEARGWLVGDRDVDLVVEEAEAASAAGVTGVPTFILGGKFALSGAQPPRQLAAAIRKVAALGARPQEAAVH
jgi:NAD(P)H dehydrogenase (quinone)